MIHVMVHQRTKPFELLAATGRKLYLERDVVRAMPRGEGVEKRITFFKIEGPLSNTAVMKMYRRMRHKPIDPYSLLAANRQRPFFADEYSNATLWKDAKGRWCYMTFDNTGRVSEIDVVHDTHDSGFSGIWYMAGEPIK